MGLGGLLAIMTLLAVLGSVANTQAGGSSSVSLIRPSIDPALRAELLIGEIESAATGSVALVPGGGTAEATSEPLQVFAAVEDVVLALPHDTPAQVVFAEADTAAALALAPVGTPTVNDNPEGYVAAENYDGPDYAVHAPITGVRAATGMAAVLAAPGTQLAAPVTGVVAAVARSAAEAGTAGWAVTISPAGRPDLHVVVRGIAEPAVGTGDRVTVGTTGLGTLGSDVVVGEDHNPLALPAALIHVAPAITAR